MWPRPLQNDKDVDEIGLGAKSAEKVKEILSKGESSRVVEAAQDENKRVVSLFARVWGVGVDTADRWYAAGVRTLEEAAKLPDLTSQQEVRVRVGSGWGHPSCCLASEISHQNSRSVCLDFSLC